METIKKNLIRIKKLNKQLAKFEVPQAYSAVQAIPTEEEIERELLLEELKIQEEIFQQLSKEKTKLNQELKESRNKKETILGRIGELKRVKKVPENKTNPNQALMYSAEEARIRDSIGMLQQKNETLVKKEAMLQRKRANKDVAKMKT